MHPKLHLFHLVKSLDVSEVKYFRAFAKRKVKSGTAGHLKLFDLLCEADEYDEEKMATQVDVTNFPALKVYLYEMIGEALLERDMKKKGVAEIFALSRQAEMFQRMGLMDGMWKKLEKAMSLCERYEEFQTWRTLLQRKESILMFDSESGQTPIGLEDFDEIFEEVKQKAKNLEAYEELFSVLDRAQRKGTNVKYTTAVGLMGHPLLKSDAPRLSNKAEIKYCQIQRSILKWTNDHDGSLQYSKRIVDILDDSPFLMLDPHLQLLFISRVTHLAMSRAESGDFDNARAAMEKLTSIVGFPVPVFERVHAIELQIAFELGDKQKGEETIALIADGLHSYRFKINVARKIAYLYQVTHFLLHFGEPEKALKWVLKMRECENIDLKRDLQDFGELLYLVCHFDLKNFSFIVKSEADKVLGYLAKRGVLTSYEETIIKGLRKSALAKTEANRKTRMSRVLIQLRTVMESPENQYKANYFPFDQWIASQITGESLISIHRNALRDHHQGQ